MDGMNEDVAELFTLLDGQQPDGIKRVVLCSILDLDPGCTRAAELLSELECCNQAHDILRMEIEQAESWASKEQWSEARQAAVGIKERFGDDPWAKAWLANAHLLWEA